MRGTLPTLACALLLAAAGAAAQDTAPGTVADPAGDTLGLGAEAPDVLGFSAFHDGPVLALRLDFAVPPGELAGLIELDTDADPATGAISDIAFLCPDLVLLGVEYTVDLFNAGGGTAPVRDAAFVVVGQAATRIEGGSLLVDVPLDLIGGAGAVRTAAVVGPPAEASDCVPNGNFLLAEIKQGRVTPIPVLGPWWAALLVLLIAVRSLYPGRRAGRVKY